MLAAIIGLVENLDPWQIMGGGAVGAGIFIGFVRSKLQTLSDSVDRIDAKLDVQNGRVGRLEVEVGRIDSRCHERHAAESRDGGVKDNEEG